MSGRTEITVESDPLPQVMGIIVLIMGVIIAGFLLAMKYRSFNRAEREKLKQFKNRENK